MPGPNPSLAGDLTPDFISLPAAENPDWNYARTKRCVLMAPSAEWVQSVFSCPLVLNGKQFQVPNRDYPYEGLMVHHERENWKMIDCVGLGLQRPDGSYLPLENLPSPRAVRLTPWRAIYHYQTPDWAGRLPITVAYYLNSANSPELTGGCVEFSFPDGLEAGGERFTPVIEPFLDLHLMLDPSSLDGHVVRQDRSNGDQRVHVSNYNRTVSFYFESADLELFESPEKVSWVYKLGTGARVEQDQPEPATLFIGETKEIGAWFCLRPRLGPSPASFRLFFGCGLDDAPLRSSLAEMQETYRQSREQDQREHALLKRLFPCSGGPLLQDAIHARIVGLTKFKTYIQMDNERDWVKAPHAGAWWFRTPWYRDVFEGLLNSFATLMRLPEEAEGIRKIIALALSNQDPLTGRVPNRIPEYKNHDFSYNASDATLLCFIAANRYIETTQDAGFARQVLRSAEKTLAAFSRQEVRLGEAAIDGAPRLEPTSGLLLSVPQHSWMDTRSQKFAAHDHQAEGLPNRVSRTFLSELWRHVGLDQDLGTLMASPYFFMPEINAQWIVMLRGLASTAAFLLEQARDPQEASQIRRTQENAGSILARAEQHFKSIFWDADRGYLFNIVYGDLAVKDRVESEPGLVAAAMLGESIFSIEELRAVLACTRRSLMLERKPLLFGQGWTPFGVIAKNEGVSVFLGDDQYHRDVVWPRSTPYLIRLLEMLGHTSEIKSLLLNTLDHQMTESAIFYNQELLARPTGNNPSPEKETRDNPVPVKNPIQFWSQWCDAFVEFFEGKE